VILPWQWFWKDLIAALAASPFQQSLNNGWRAFRNLVQLTLVPPPRDALLVQRSAYPVWITLEGRECVLDLEGGDLNKLGGYCFCQLQCQTMTQTRDDVMYNVNRAARLNRPRPVRLTGRCPGTSSAGDTSGNRPTVERTTMGINPRRTAAQMPQCKANADHCLPVEAEMAPCNDVSPIPNPEFQETVDNDPDQQTSLAGTLGNLCNTTG
jgi:hypothetical protein